MAALGSGSSGPTFAVRERLPEDARFEIGSITKTMTAALVRFTASGQIAMLRVIAPDEALPW